MNPRSCVQTLRPEDRCAEKIDAAGSSRRATMIPLRLVLAMPDTGSAADKPNDDVSPGDVVGGRYVVEEVLGRGGMGIVVAARHEPLGHRVAMKLVRGSASAEAFERFTREARIIASLESEHVVRVTDFGMHGAIPFMVMELLSGRDLRAELQLRESLPYSEAVDYVIQACDGLWAAHAKGVVHRDVKPGNLFLTTRPSGERVVKVLDFGVSKLAVDDGAPELTRTSTMIGSPLYMSPEQVRDARNVDERADVWSLGIVLHKLIAGAAPFEGQTTSALCAAIAADPPTLLRAHAPHVPPELEAVVARCLQKSRALRYPTVVALARDLLPFATAAGRAAGASLLARAPEDGDDASATLAPGVDGGPVLGALEPAIEQTVAATVIEPRPPARKWRKVHSALLATALVFGGSFVGLRVWSARPTPARATAATQTPIASSAGRTAESPASVAEPSAPPTVAPARASSSSSASTAPSASAPVLVGLTGDGRKRQRPPSMALPGASARGKTAGAPGFGGSALDGHD
jgi:serine/threonine-protein kinase